MRILLGISAYYHDSAAALLVDGEIVAAAQEERFSRRKNDERFPVHAVFFCLKQAGIGLADVDAVVFYDKPVVKFSRLLESFLAIAPAGLPAWLRVLPSWLSEKLNLRQTIRDELDGLPAECPILFTEHHVAHAASAFYPSPFDRAAILTVDGVGEWATTTISRGAENRIEMMRELHFPHSLGLLYSAFTAYCGFRVNSGEYKLMGLAPYGQPRFADVILENMIDLKPDGSFRLNIDCFGFLKGRKMTNRRFEQLMGGPPRDPESPFEQRHMDIAASVQEVIGEAMLRLASQVREVTGEHRLCLAGGVALNCVANGKLQRAGLFDEIWIQPAAGDAGGALGAALEAWHQFRKTDHIGEGGAVLAGTGGDSMHGTLLGPAFSESEIRQTLEAHDAVFEQLDEEAMLGRAAELLANGAVLPDRSKNSITGQSSPSPDSQPALKIRVEIDPKLSPLLSVGDALFVYARAVGIKSPVAAIRQAISPWPIEVILDDASSVMHTSPLFSFDAVEIGAHVSRSGEAMARTGDFVARAVATPTDDGVAVQIKISAVLP